MGSSSQKNSQPDEMVACKICHMYFDPKRIISHERTCGKRTSTAKPIINKEPKTASSKPSDAEGDKQSTNDKKGQPVTTINTTSKTPVFKGNPLKKENDAIESIRRARKIRAFIAGGGVLSNRSPTIDPPPPIKTPDFIQCPHCGRQFNNAAAERHIPKCKEMYHNKPKPVSTKVTKRPQKSPPLKDSDHRSDQRGSNKSADEPQISKSKDMIDNMPKPDSSKVADQPQSPPVENPDYIQCPHCNRWFNKAAAERHIPKCEDMLHNKPKPASTEDSDLPQQPPPFKNSNYMKCPVHSRGFNKAVDEPHVSKCRDMIHNKPKPDCSNDSDKSQTKPLDSSDILCRHCSRPFNKSVIELRISKRTDIFHNKPKPESQNV